MKILFLLVVLHCGLVEHLTLGQLLTRQERQEQPDTIVNNNKIAPEFIESYQEFAQDLLQDEIFVERSENFGTMATSPFSVGYLLSVVKEKVFHVPVSGFDSALRISSDWINYAWKALIESLLDDSNIYVSSTIYSMNRSLIAPLGVKNLKTEVVYTDFSMPRVAVPAINARISSQTFGRINDQLIPQGGWYGPSIWSFTEAVFINTFIYKNKFVNKLSDIGEGRFQKEKVRLLESAGDFTLRRTPDYTAVTLPLHDNRRSLVMVLPREDLHQLLPHLEEILYTNKPEYTETKGITLVVPAMNFSISNEYYKQLYNMGVNNTMCKIKKRNVNFLQPVSQALYVYLDHDKFEVASATGAQLNNYKRLREATIADREQDDSRSVESDRPVEPVKDNKEVLDDEDDRLRFDNGDSTTFSPEESGGIVEEVVIEELQRPQREVKPLRQSRYLNSQIPGSLERITFTRPFFWYLNDNILGPVFAGMVHSFEDYRAKSNTISQGFDDLHKYLFWSCGDTVKF